MFIVFLALTLLLIEIPKCSGRKVYWSANGTVNASYFENLVTNSSLDSCIRTQCKEDTNCVAVFSIITLNCHRVRLSSHVVFWMREDRFTDHRVYKTIFNKPGSDFLQRGPQALLMFDTVYRGKNLGSEKDVPEILTPEYYHTTISGPPGRGSPHIHYAQRTVIGGDKPTFFNTRPDDTSQTRIEFTSDFTILLWVKIIPQKNVGPHIINSVDNRFWFHFWPTDDGRSLRIHPADGCWIQTIDNTTGVNEWRHVALAFQRYCCCKWYIKFYLNGHIWPVNPSFNDRDCGPIEPVYNFRLWNYDATNNLHGSMTCYMIFGKILLQNEINDIMNNCP